MWARLRTSSTNKDKVKKITQPCRSINDEYLCAVRTKSFADFFVKVQIVVNGPSSEVLLDPCQQTITSVLESSIFSNKRSDHHLKSLLFNYFNVSAEASSFCSHLLRTLNELQSDHRLIHKAINAIDDIAPHRSSDQFTFLIAELQSRVTLSNLNKHDFKLIHEKHSSVLQQLRSNRKRVWRKIKMIKFFNRASGLCITLACGLLASAAIFLAMHTLTAVLMGPAIFSLPLKPLKRKIQNFRLLKYGFLRKIVEQLDVAAKGAYILNRDFDTMGRLVARLQDEIEHNKAMIRFCSERREERLCFRVVKELKKYEFGFRKQVEELEEHVYLCLVTINKTRALVVKEISRNL